MASRRFVPRVYLEPAPRASEDAVLLLRGDGQRHLRTVLRAREGDALTVFDGRGGEYESRIEGLERDAIRIRVGKHLPVERESPISVTLLQGVSSGERMDLTVQKAVELGVTAIFPVAAERSVVRLSGERAESRRAHWQRIAVAACEQCGRNRVPEVGPVQPLESALRSAQEAKLRLLLDPDADSRLRDLGVKPGDSVALAAGPEAGFSEREADDLRRAGFSGVRLGPRVLRTETAALAALASLAALYGDG